MWIAKTAIEAAQFLGINRRQFQDYIAKGCPGSRGNYPLKEIVQWVRHNVWCKRQVVGEELLEGPVSPALERFREARANLAELDLREREGELVDRETVHTGVVAIAGLVRSAGEQLQRQYGADAQAILDDALDDAEREIQERFGT